MRSFAACIFLLIATPLCACLWDRDTIAMEAQGRLEVVETMVGWFDRFPAEYYQMRLERVTRELVSTPEKLDLYDDAAVSSDRLGRHDEAVAWMTRKNLHMLQLPPAQTADHRYRMHANLGVFRTHLWLKSPERNSHPEKLKLAIEEVRMALKINPNAHFGRERAHLALLEWWQEGLENQGVMQMNRNPGQLQRGIFPDFPETTESSSSHLVKGWCGLIQMGSAQESFDVHYLVAWGLLHDSRLQGRKDTHFTLAYLSCLRMAELMMEGQQPVCAGFDQKWWMKTASNLQKEDPQMTREKKLDSTADELIGNLVFREGSTKLQPIPAWFHQARVAAQQRLAAKTAFMKQRFAQGMHPDTRPDFWRGWKEPVMPEVPHTKFEQVLGVSQAVWFDNPIHMQGLLGVLLMGGVVSLYVIVVLRRRRRARSGRVQAVG